MAREQVTEIVAEMVANVLSVAVSPGEGAAAGETITSGTMWPTAGTFDAGTDLSRLQPASVGLHVRSQENAGQMATRSHLPQSRGGGIRTRGRSPYDRFQGGSDRPLRHPSSCP